jgi:hypothetical protein
MFPAFSSSKSGAATTVNLGDSAFSFTAPGGFSAWDANPSLPATYRFNESDRQAEVAVYFDRLRACGDGSGAGSWRSVRTTPSIAPSGKKLYVEFTGIRIAGTTNAIVGFMNGSATLGASFSGAPGQTTDGVGYQANGNARYNLNLLATGSAFDDNDVVGCALDCAAQKAWFRVNGGGWFNAAIGSQDPSSNVGGVSCPGLFAAGDIYAAAGFWQNGASVGVNLGDSAFAFTPPAGFSSPVSASATVNPAMLQTAVCMP